MWYVYLFCCLLLLIAVMLTKMLIIKLFLLCALGYLIYLVVKYFERNAILLFCVFLASFLMYWHFFHIHYQITQTVEVRTELMLIIDKKETENTLQYTCESLTLFPKKIYQLFINKEQPPYKLGEVLKVTGKASPIIITKNRYVFNYEQYLYSQRIFHQLFNPKIEIAHALSFKQQILLRKQQLTDYITNIYHPTLQGILSAFILGNTSQLRMEHQYLLELGILQFFTLSARYLQQIQFIIAYIARLLHLSDGKLRIFKFLFTYTGMLFLGKNVTLKKTCLSLLIEHCNELLKPEYKITFLERIVITGILLMLYNPYIIFNTGYIYTFLFSFSLLWYRKKTLHLNKLKRFFAYPCFFLLTSLPILLYQNQSLHLLQLIYQIIFSFMGKIIFLSCLFLLFFPYTQHIFIIIMQLFGTGMEAFSPILSTLTIPIAYLFLSQVFIYYLIYMQLLQDKQTKKHYFDTWCYYGLLFVYLIGVHYVNISLNSIHFLSLPQGEITIIKEADIVYVIDVGGSAKEEDNAYQTTTIIMEFFRKLHITKIHHLILTHGDADHIGALSSFTQQIFVEKIYYQSLPFEPTSNGANGTLFIRLEGVMKVGVLQLFSVYDNEYVNENNRSIITYGVFGGKHWLFMGDLEKEGENILLQRYPHLKIDVLKVGHHGSKTSTTATFLNTIQPHYAIITVQQKNIHKHPHQEVLDRLDNMRVKYFITNKMGSIHYFYLGKFGFFIL